MTSSPALATRDRLFSVRDVTTIALFAAVISASAQVSIPIGAVPITLQVFAVLLAGLLLRPLAAFAAVGVYLLLGAAGVPVFAGFASGIGVLIGPTGGYLFGFAAAALAVALLVKALRQSRTHHRRRRRLRSRSRGDLRFRLGSAHARGRSLTCRGIHWRRRSLHRARCREGRGRGRSGLIHPPNRAGQREGDRLKTTRPSSMSDP